MRRGPLDGSAISSSAPPDLRATRDLLVDGIGCKVSDEVDGIIHFLRCSTDHHNIGLVHSPVPILQHYSWECDDIDHVGHTATALYRADTSRHAWGLGRHFAGSNFYWYLRDPAGSFLELYSDFDRIDDDAAWEQNRSPLSIEHAANVWGPNLPTEFVVPDDLAALEAGWAPPPRSGGHPGPGRPGASGGVFDRWNRCYGDPPGPPPPAPGPPPPSSPIRAAPAPRAIPLSGVNRSDASTIVDT